MDDEDFIENKRTDRIYASKEFGIQDEQGARYISRVLEDDAREGLDRIEEEWVLRRRKTGKQQLKVLVTMDERHIKKLVLQNFDIVGDGSRPKRRANFTLVGPEIDKLLELAALAKHAEFVGTGKVRLNAAALEGVDIDQNLLRALLRKDHDFLAQIVESEVTERDVIATAYRKGQLAYFERLLEDEDYFKSQLGGRGAEKLWQDFFEMNRWIFGYGLFLIAAQGFASRKLEQVVAGASISERGKRADALMRTNGRIASLCFVEIKTHETPLLEPSPPYRPGAWAISTHVAGAIAQIHKTIDRAETDIRRKLVVKDDDGNPTGEEAYLCRPRSVVVCGDLRQFRTAAGVNEEKYVSFELYRRQLASPEIVTFDELLERAKAIVETEADR